MATEAVERNEVETASALIGAVATKALYLTLAASGAGTLIALAFGQETAVAYAAGALSGLVTQRMQIKSAAKSVLLGPSKAALYSQIRFYSRIALTALLLGAFIGIVKVAALPLLIGFFVTHAITIAAAVAALKKELKT
ncbi:MAG: hypothetical protein OEV59_05415 [Deltaproteobacteria bacterium]|nr:hypothetical protein [Deltaproteobacteria bacterium]